MLMQKIFLFAFLAHIVSLYDIELDDGGFENIKINAGVAAFSGSGTGKTIHKDNFSNLFKGINEKIVRSRLDLSPQEPLDDVFKLVVGSPSMADTAGGLGKSITDMNKMVDRLNPDKGIRFGILFMYDEFLGKYAHTMTDNAKGLSDILEVIENSKISNKLYVGAEQASRDISQNAVSLIIASAPELLNTDEEALNNIRSGFHSILARRITFAYTSERESLLIKKQI